MTPYSVPRHGGEALLLFGSKMRRLPSPRRHFRKQCVVVCHEHAPVLEIEVVQGRKVRIVVAGEHREPAGGRGGEGGKSGLVRPGGGVEVNVAGVERVAIEHEMVRALQQRREPIHARHGAVRLPDVQIGNDAKARGGRGSETGIRPGRGQSRRMVGRKKGAHTGRPGGKRWAGG